MRDPEHRKLGERRATAPRAGQPERLVDGGIAKGIASIGMALNVRPMAGAGDKRAPMPLAITSPQALLLGKRPPVHRRLSWD